MDQIKIGQYIADKRKSQSMTQEQLAEKLGKSRKAVSKWERGVCLPDVSVYTELCDILGITLNEFFAGEDIEPADVAEKSEKNLLGVATEGSNRNGRLKKILVAIAVIALILAAILGLLVKKEGYLLTNYIKVLDESTQESRIAETVTTESPLLFSFEVDEEYYSASIIIREFKNGVDNGSGGGPQLSFTGDDKRRGTIAIVTSTMAGNGIAMILSSQNGKITIETGLDEVLRDPENNTDYVVSLAGQSYNVIKIRANEEIPLGALYASTREEDHFPGMAKTIDETVNAISTAAPEYCYLFSVKFETADTASVIVPDLTGKSLNSAKDMLRSYNLNLGNVTYYDTIDDKEAFVYHQSLQPGSRVPVGTNVDIDVKKK